MKLENNLQDTQRIADLLKLDSISQEMVLTLCGEFLGAGSFRSVYEYNLDRDYVVKIEPLNTGCNFTEYMMWNEIKGLCGDLEWVKDWFAPVKWISPNGKILVMKRTEEKNLLPRPDKIPKFLWDVKSNNFGWIGKNFVCHDYGQFYNFTHYQKGMQKVKW